MKAILVALVLAACAFTYAIGIAWADDGGSNATSSGGAPATQPVQQSQDDNPRPRDDCPEKDGSGGSGSESSGSSDTDVRF